jgi:hypothetical protein
VLGKAHVQSVTARASTKGRPRELSQETMIGKKSTHVWGVMRCHKIDWLQLRVGASLVLIVLEFWLRQAALQVEAENRWGDELRGTDKRAGT